MDIKIIIKYLTLLGIDYNKEINIQDLHDQYRLYAKAYHPDTTTDVFKDGEQFKLLTEAYEFLKNNLNEVNRVIRGFSEVSSSKKTDTFETNSTQQTNSNSELENRLFAEFKFLKRLKNLYVLKETDFISFQNKTFFYGPANDLVYKKIFLSKYSWIQYLQILNNFLNVVDCLRRDSRESNLRKKKYPYNEFCTSYFSDISFKGLKNCQAAGFFVTYEEVISHTKYLVKEVNKNIKFYGQKPHNFLNVDHYLRMLGI